MHVSLQPVVKTIAQMPSLSTTSRAGSAAQAGLANVFQGPLMDALKTALKEGAA